MGMSRGDHAGIRCTDKIEVLMSAVSANADREPLHSDHWRGAGGRPCDESCGWKVVWDAYSRMVHCSCMGMSRGDHAGIR